MKQSPDIEVVAAWTAADRGDLVANAENEDAKRKALKAELVIIQAQAHNIAGMQFAQGLFWRF